MSFDNQSVLIIGGAGFVGSNLAKLILKKYNNVSITIVDNLLSSNECNVPKAHNVNFIKGSITDDQILHDISDQTDFAFHLACYHGNQSSIANPLEDHENNTLTSLKLFDRLSEIRNLKKVVYSGAGCAVAEKTFDEASATTEDAPVSLYHDSPYSISKLIGELYGNYFLKARELPFVKARFQNVYGPGEILGAGQWRGTKHTVWRNVIPSFIWKAMHGESLPLDKGGIATRDFIFVEDICQGLIDCALKGTPGEIYNLATGVETSIYDLANQINTLTNNPSGLSMEPPRDWDNSGKRFASTNKTEQQLGFKSQVALSNGLEQTVNWYQDNRELIFKVMAHHSLHVPEVSGYRSK